LLPVGGWFQARKVDPASFDRYATSDVLPHYAAIGPSPTVRPFGTGLINRTFLVEDAAGGRFILQWVSPIFPPGIHRNIEAVTARLQQQGLVTPRLYPTRSGELFLDLPGSGVWRLLTHVAGVSYDVIASPAQAQAAGQLVGRFHRAVDGLTHDFAERRRGAHDTPRHLQRLREALAAHGQHRLFAQVQPLGRGLLDRAAELPPLPALAERICHGDLKFNNILFSRPEDPVCLIDLDTVGPQLLAFELGDAWRSWCNRSGENEPEAAFDLQILAASLEGYRAGLGRALSEPERRALLLGLEWVSLELAARFATDALEESYFGWDGQRFATRGDHSLVRARGQWSLHEAVVATRPQRAHLLGLDG
jgi:Ser/Thr protein kinase RdoA (MazF antagonist)